VDTFGHNFDHNSVTFQLTGNHAQVACGQAILMTKPWQISNPHRKTAFPVIQRKMYTGAGSAQIAGRAIPTPAGCLPHIITIWLPSN
jgi:hypothetical protein